MSNQRILFIYHDCTQIIEKYPSCTKKIPLPKSIDLSSLLITDDRNNMIQFRYKNPKDTITVTKGTLTHTGKLMSLTDTSVTLYLNDTSITIRNYDTLTVHNPPGHPYLKIDHPRPITVNYLFSEVTWSPIGTGIITDSHLNLRIATQINNNTNHDINATVNCIAGSISKHHPSPHAMRTLSILAMESPTVSKVEDYTMYELGQQKLKQINIINLGIINAPMVKFYEHHTNEPSVHLGYRFKTTQFIPNINLFMYTKDHKYLGTTTLEEHQSNEEVDIVLGGTSMVRCETDISVEEPEKNIRVEHVEIKIINSNIEGIFLLIKHLLGPRKFIQSTCPIAKQHDGYLEWYFLIPPTNTQYFKCTITSTT
jgi:hypothetical protein